MPGEIPFWVEGELKLYYPLSNEAYVRVPNGNVYVLKPSTPGIEFNKLKVGMIIQCEVTTKLTRVLSARIVK